MEVGLHLITLSVMNFFLFSYRNSKMIPNGYLMFEDENFIESSVAKLNALRKSGQFCDVKLQVILKNEWVFVFWGFQYTGTVYCGTTEYPLISEIIL